MAAIVTIPVDIIAIQPGALYSHITFKILDSDDTEGAGLAGVGSQILAVDVANSVISAGSITTGLASLAFTQP